MPKQEVVASKNRLNNPRKLHVIDPGLIAAFHANPERDVGRKLETVVFLEMRRVKQDCVITETAAKWIYATARERFS